MRITHEELNFNCRKTSSVGFRHHLITSRITFISKTKVVTRPHLFVPFVGFLVKVGISLIASSCGEERLIIPCLRYALST